MDTIFSGGSVRFHLGSCVFLLLAVTGMASGASGQEVKGKVLGPDRAPIASAEVTFLTEDGTAFLSMLSDRSGSFQTMALEEGRYWIKVDRLGYQPAQHGPLALVKGDTIEVELFMDIDAIPVEGITVTASPRPRWEHLEPPAMWEFWERKDYMEKLGIGRFLTAKDLAPLSGSPAALAVADFAPFLVPEPVGYSSYRFKIRGRRGCFPPIFLDGHPLRGSPVIDDWITLSQIAAVEIYRGASDVPGEFRVPGSNCGAISIWTRRGPVRE
jgi:hypothetical protein